MNKKKFKDSIPHIDCPKCGVPNNSASVYCRFCGYKFQTFERWNNYDVILSKDFILHNAKLTLPLKLTYFVLAASIIAYIWTAICDSGGLVWFYYYYEGQGILSVLSWLLMSLFIVSGLLALYLNIRNIRKIKMLIKQRCDYIQGNTNNDYRFAIKDGLIGLIDSTTGNVMVPIVYNNLFWEKPYSILCAENREKRDYLY